MPDPSRLALFVAAALVLLAVPGPAVLYIVTQSITHGRRAGVVSCAGVFTGTLVHVGAATIGLSALLASSATAFDVVKYAGAAYLIYVGLRRLVGRERELTPELGHGAYASSPAPSASGCAEAAAISACSGTCRERSSSASAPSRRSPLR